MKIIFLFLISLFLLQVFVEPLSVDTTSASNNELGYEAELIHKKVKIHKLHHPKKKLINCDYACARRCRESSRKNVCSRACKTCCTRCQCVPPGTYGHKGACPCYAKLKTHGNKPKCP